MAEPAFDLLLEELRSVVDRVDPTPEPVLAAAKEAFAWRTIDAELAELTADSLATAGGVRATDGARLLTFHATGVDVDVEVEVEVADTGQTRRLTGQLVPPGGATVTVRWGDGSVDVEADDLGRFTAAGIPAGTVSLVVVRQGGEQPRRVATSWVSI